MARGRVSVLEMLTGKALPSKSERDPVARTEDSGDGVELVSATTAAMPKMEPKKRKQDSSSSIRLGSGSGNSRKKWLFRPCSRKRKAPEAKAGERRLGARGNWSRPAPEEARAEVVISDLEDTLLMDLLAFTRENASFRAAPAASTSAPRLSLGLEDVLARERGDRRTSRRLRQRTLRRSKSRRGEDGGERTEEDELEVLRRRFAGYLRRRSAGSALHWEQRYRPCEVGTHRTVNTGVCERIKKWLECWSQRARDGWSSEDEDFLMDGREGSALRKRGLLLHGPPGSGKTAAISALASLCQCAIVEVNGSESRTGLELKKKILEATQSSSEASKRAVCALEEVDTPSDEDRGFLAAIAEVLKTTKRPIVLTCNDPAKVPPQVLDLVDALEFRQPTLLELFVHCALVLVAEQRQCGWADLLTWLEGEGIRDYRSSVNNLQLWAGAGLGVKVESEGAPGECQGLEAMELASQADAEASRRSLGGDGDIPGADGV